MSTSTEYGVYTWQTVNGATVCNIYANVGSGTTKVEAQQAGERLRAANPTDASFGYMVAPVKPLPA